MKRVCFLAIVLLLAAIAGRASAQEFRGSISGRVTDTSKGLLPGATVTVTNIATNVATSTTTNGEGDYTILYLTPGTYTLSVELAGFKKMVRDGIEVRVGDKLAVDATLDVGRVEETVSVTAESPLLETRGGSAGQVIGEKQISLMPLSDGNPFALTRLVPGVAYNGDLKFSRPFDNGGTSAINADGSTGGNEFTLDGSPNMANGRRVAFVPPAGAVSEFKVVTSSFDASEGHTAGAMVNVTLKSGTNRVKGEAYEYMRRTGLEASDFFIKKSGTAKPEVTYDRPGFSLGGPVVIPGLYDGHDRTFAFGAVEWLYDTFPEPGPRTVPSLAMRTGDFSELLPDRSESRRARRPDCFPRQHHPVESHQPDRAAVDEILPGAKPAGHAGQQQLLLQQSAIGHLLLDFDPRRSPNHRQAAHVRALHAEQPPGVAQRLFRNRERHRADR